MYSLYNKTGIIVTVNEEESLDNIFKDEIQFRWCPSKKYDSFSSEFGMDCQALFNSDNETIDRAKNWSAPCVFNDSTMMMLTSECSDLRRNFPFYWPLQSPNKINNEYALAFVVTVAKNSEQVVRLFQTIYRPWNLYCLTYDNHTSLSFKNTMHNLHKCFDNIIMPDTFINIKWAGFSILESTMNCLKLLSEHKINWRYVQLLSWNDFPLKTNEKMVEIMQILNGSQDSELSKGQAKKFLIFYNESRLDESRKFIKKSLPPGYMTIYKGSLASTLSRDFVTFVFNNQVAKEFYHWSKSSWAPEEQFWSTLIHNLHIGVPNGFPGSCLNYYDLDKTDKRSISRYQLWSRKKCRGQLKHSSCVFGVGDLDKLYDRPELVAHKVFLDFQPATFYCLSQLHFNKTYNLVANTLNEVFYKNLPSVRYQNTVDKQYFQC